MHLEGLGPEAIEGCEIATGEPRLYQSSCDTFVRIEDSCVDLIALEWWLLEPDGEYHHSKRHRQNQRVRDVSGECGKVRASATASRLLTPHTSILVVMDESCARLDGLHGKGNG